MRIEELRALAAARNYKGIPVRPVQFHDGYYCSAAGDVFSTQSRWASGRLYKMKLQKTKDGYLIANLVLEGRRIHKRAHRLVALSWLKIPDNFRDLHVAHINGNKLDNHHTNLKWCSAAENNKDKVRLGETAKGTEIAQAKLNVEDVIAIRKLHGLGATRSMLAALFELDKENIDNVVNRKSWKHISDDYIDVLLDIAEAAKNAVDDCDPMFLTTIKLKAALEALEKK